MRKILLSALAAAVLVVLFASAQGTAALWRVEGTLNPGTITTGRLSLAVGTEASTVQDFAFAALDTSTLAPGGFVQAPLTISNTGTTDLGYSLSGAAPATTPQGAADAALAAAVELAVHAIAGSAACTDGVASPGMPLYEGPLSAAGFGTTRELLAEATETLCIRVALPANAPHAAAGGTFQLVLFWRGDQR